MAADGYSVFGLFFMALAFLAGANSIFVGDRLLTTPNPDKDDDAQLFADLGLKPMSASKRVSR